MRQQTSPTGLLATSFVDGSRIYNDSQLSVDEFSSWNVSLKGPAQITKIVVWNSEKDIPFLRITVSDGETRSISKFLNSSGRCRYEWSPAAFSSAISVGLETSGSAVLHVDEVEVIGVIDRGEAAHVLKQKGYFTSYSDCRNAD